MGTVVALFDTYADSERALNTLVDRGFDRSAVSIAAQESAVSNHNGEMHAPNMVVEGASDGAIAGTGVGLVAGLAALMIPGVGPLFVTGALASVITSTLAGATAGAATGGLSRALAEHGLPSDTADLYADGVRDGGVVLSVHTDRVQQASDALQASKATNIHNVAD